MKKHSCKHCPSSCSHTALKCAWSHCRVALPEVPELKPAFLRNSLIWVGFHSGSAKHTSHPDHFVFFRLVQCGPLLSIVPSRGMQSQINACWLLRRQWQTGWSPSTEEGTNPIQSLGSLRIQPPWNGWDQLKPLGQDWMTCDKEVTPSGTSTARAFARPGLESSRSCQAITTVTTTNTQRGNQDGRLSGFGLGHNFGLGVGHHCQSIQLRLQPERHLSVTT